MRSGLNTRSNLYSDRSMFNHKSIGVNSKDVYSLGGDEIVNGDIWITRSGERVKIINTNNPRDVNHPIVVQTFSKIVPSQYLSNDHDLCGQYVTYTVTKFGTLYDRTNPQMRKLVINDPSYTLESPYDLIQKE